VGVLRRDEIVDAPRAKWRVAVPEMEEIIRKREQTREICTRIFDNGFESLAVKLLFRERMAEDAHELLRRLEDPKNFEQEYAKIIILRKTGDTIRAKNMINSTREEKTIEEMELLGIELAKIDSIAARRLADVHLEKYPKSMEI
jgi:dienelactone hydrolase